MCADDASDQVFLESRSPPKAPIRANHRHFPNTQPAPLLAQDQTRSPRPMSADAVPTYVLGRELLDQTGVGGAQLDPLDG